MARPLPDYYKTKCEFSGEDAPDRPDIVEYHENCSRYLHHYYKTNCKVSGEDAF